VLSRVGSNCLEGGAFSRSGARLQLGVLPARGTELGGL